MAIRKIPWKTQIIPFVAICVILGRTISLSKSLSTSTAYNEESLDIQMVLTQDVTRLKISNATTPLQFIHITKTGGSAVEAAAAKQNIAWGVSRYEARPGPGWAHIKPDLGWPRPPPVVANGFQGELWHTPPSWMDPNPYEGFSTFTIVRNPYDRVVSEYYCKHFGIYARHNRKRITDEHLQEMDELRRHTKSERTWLRKDREFERDMDLPFHSKRQAIQRDERYRPRSQPGRLESSHWSAPTTPQGMRTRTQQDEGSGVEFHDTIMRQQNESTEDQRRGLREDTLEDHSADPHLRMHDESYTLNMWIKRNLKRENLRTGHMLPQYYYCFDENHKQTVTHILKYENLQHEFRELMATYNLTVQLPPKTSDTRPRPGVRPRMTKNDLQPDTIQMINTLMAPDFEYFGYTMIDA